MKARKSKTPTLSAQDRRVAMCMERGIEPTELALARMEVMQMLAHAGMSKCWTEGHATKRWPDFAPSTELGKYIHKLVTEAVAKAKDGRTE